MMTSLLVKNYSYIVKKFKFMKNIIAVYFCKTLSPYNIYVTFMLLPYIVFIRSSENKGNKFD